ncbi:MAG: galactose-1-epimerase [Actinobacteria bacterium]|nr:galactose-1-epimerase [Actinomycetota bacterium]
MKKMMYSVGLMILLTAPIFFSCQKRTENGKVEMNVKKELFGKTSDGTAIELFTLTNYNGMKARIMTYGAILVSLEVPDRNGKLADITLGYDDLAGYLKNNPYFGATVGRYANRIAKGRFTLNGVKYQLAQNDGENHLHGGVKGFDKVVWKGEPVKEANTVGVKLTYLNKDGEEGYPGNLSCTVVYKLTNENALIISYEATTDKATPINLTHHSYFNLAGQGNGDILNHKLMINADKYTPVDAGLIPTGEIRSVKNTPMDFTTPQTIGSRIAEVKGGYDHNYIINKKADEMGLVARVFEPTSGRVMEIYSTEPGVQFYSGNFLDGSITGKSGKVYRKYYGFCLEPQHFPDSPNKPQFPSVILNPGEKFESESIYKFYTK